MKVIHSAFYGCCFAAIFVSIAAFLLHIITGFFVLGLMTFLLSITYADWFEDPKTTKQILEQEDNS